MSRSKCPQCGLINLATDEACRRCEALLNVEDARQAIGPEVASEPPRRSLAKRLSWICGMTLVILFICYTSLLMTSDQIGYDQRQAVRRAVQLLDQRGFRSEAFMLNHLVSFRSTDNWWNMQVGHREAYAATNFPFEIITLYPEFFETATDDTERAVILLHESYHLFGSGEGAALEGVWRNKQRLDWTEEKYGRSKVWQNTKELTMAEAPALFRCGPEGHSDCTTDTEAGPTR